MFFDFVVNRIQPEDRIDGIQVAFAPGLQFRQQFVGNGVESTVGDIDAVEVFNVGTNVLVAGAEGEQGQDLAFDLLGQVGLVFLDQLGFKGASAITGCIEFEAASGTFNGFGCAAVFAVRGLALRQVAVQLGLHGGFGQLFNEGREYAVLAGEVFAFAQTGQGGLDIKVRFFGSHKLSSLFV